MVVVLACDWVMPGYELMGGGNELVGGDWVIPGKADLMSWLIVVGKKVAWFVGRTGVVGMKKNCCVDGESGVRPEKAMPLVMLGLGRLGSR